MPPKKAGDKKAAKDEQAPNYDIENHILEKKIEALQNLIGKSESSAGWLLILSLLALKQSSTQESSERLMQIESRVSGAKR
jgi:hypothetical protein